MPYTDKNVNDFLRDFLSNIETELPGNSFRFSDFDAAYEKGLIPLNKPNQYVLNEKEDLSWIEDFRNTLFHIGRVLNNPRFTITSHKETVGIEKIVKIDSQDVLDSSKKDSYWSKDNEGEIIPKQFQTSVNERDICIYENRFVVFVTDLMLDYVNQTMYRIKKSIRFASRSFDSDNFTFKDVENVLDLAKFKQFKRDDKRKRSPITYVPLLTSNKAQSIKNLEILDTLRKELTRITFSSFYTTVKSSGVITYDRVYATNLLVGDHDYSEIYNFYYRLLKLRRVPPYKAPIYRPWYYDFVTLSLFVALKELGFKFNKNRLMFDEVHHIILKNCNVEKEGVKLHIDMVKDTIELTFNVQYIEGKFHKIPNLLKKRENRIALIMRPNPKSNDAEEVKKLYSSLIKEKLEKEDFTNAFIVSPHEEYNFSNTIVVSPFVSNVDLSLKNMIQSALIFVEGDSKMYSKVCPICGCRVDGEWDDGNCHCPECNSIWTSLISGDDHKYQNTIWLKAIKRSK